MEDYWSLIAKDNDVLLDILSPKEDITFDLIINATASSLGKDSAIFPENLKGVFLVRHDVWQANAILIKGPEQNKAKFSDGLGMLVEQAAASFGIWHHQKPDTKSIYEIL